MRISIYKDTLENGRGADVATAALAEGLASRGHDIAVFTHGGKGFPGSSLPVEPLSEWIPAQFDVMVSSGTNELLDICESANRAGIPILQQFHTRPSHVFKWKRFFRNRRIASALRRVAAIQVLRDLFVPEVKRLAPDVPVEVIGNWSSCSIIAEQEEERKILCPGALNRDKGQELLIRAFAQIAKEFPGWTVEIYGKGRASHEMSLQRMARRLTGERVRFHGYCDLAEAYARCAFVAFPSRDEGFPLVLVDAATFGKPALTIHDWIGLAAHQKAGGLVASGNVAAYAEGLRRLMADAVLRRRLGENARTFCAEHYSRDKILDKWEKLLNDLVHLWRCAKGAVLVE